MRCLLALLFSALALGAIAKPLPEVSWIESFDGTRLRVLSSGSGEALVLVPGFTMAAEIWQGQFDAFSGTYRVVSFDPRGQGQSSKPGHGYDSRRRARDIHAILGQLGLQKAVLLGWSLGALDVLNYLQLFGSERLRGVVLVDNSVDRNYSSGPTGERLLESLRHEPYEQVIREFVPSMFRVPLAAQRLDELTRISLQTPQQAAVESIAKATSGVGLAADLNKTGLPALYAVTPRFAEEGRKLKAALGPGFHLEVFQHSGHALFIDEPEHFNQSLASFIQSLP